MYNEFNAITVKLSKYIVEDVVMETKVNSIAPFFVILAGICWGIIGIFSRALLMSGFTPVQVTASRCIVTALSFFFYLFLVNRDKLKIEIKDLWYFIGTGLLSFVFFNICFFITIEVTTLSMAAILLYTAPYFVIIISAFLFKEKITKNKIIALILAFTGCVFTTGIIGTDDIIISKLGLLTGIGSGIGYGLYSVFGRIALKKYHPYTVTAYTFIVATIGILPFSGITEMVAIAGGSFSITINILLLGIISTLAPFLLYTKGLQGMEAGKASVMAFVEPMVATIVGIIYFKERITALCMVGIFLIFVSILMLNLKKVTE